MPMKQGNSPKAIRANIKKAHGEGKSHAQAVAIALNIAEKVTKKRKK